jgi:hypothetical protein
MTERPIIFTADSILAILAGRKTQTRRLVHPRHLDKLDDAPFPYGVPGDRLWCRETWAWDGAQSRHVEYRATWKCERDPPVVPCEHGPARWRSPIFMPRWASRLTLWLLEERVQPLHKISEADARAEGFERARGAAGQMVGIPLTARDSFMDAWDRINGKRAPWASNPWVWVLGFRRIQT